VDVDRAVEQAVAGLRAGRPVLLPTDTVYGLCAAADREAPARELYRLKGRADSQPSALLAASLDALFEALPELRDGAGDPARALLPGPYTLVLPNPSRRYRWLNGTRTDAIGVRVPDLPEATRRVVEALGFVMATSANDPGGPSPASLDEVPQRIRDGCAAELDLGRLPGTPSTVIDFVGADPYVIRDGAVPAAEALERVRVFRDSQ
jgi:L-threonylcarbamoyladenylate synthase